MRIAVLVAVIAACAVLSVVALADTVPAPIYMSNSTLGGGMLNEYTLGVEGGAGANNIGLLIRTYGKVTYVDMTNQYFYIDDGAGRWDGTERLDHSPVLGVRVSYGGLASGVPAITPPTVDDKVVVTGIISTCLVPPETPPTGLVRPNVRARSQDDIVSLP